MSPAGGQPVAFDLSAYAGQQVELIVSYVTDPAFGGTGAIIDDTRLTTDGRCRRGPGLRGGPRDLAGAGPARGFADQPARLGAGRAARHVHAGVATEDTLLLGFGLEQLESAEARAELVADALELLAG